MPCPDPKHLIIFLFWPTLEKSFSKRTHNRFPHTFLCTLLKPVKSSLRDSRGVCAACLKRMSKTLVFSRPTISQIYSLTNSLIGSVWCSLVTLMPGRHFLFFIDKKGCKKSSQNNHLSTPLACRRPGILTRQRSIMKSKVHEGSCGTLVGMSKRAHHNALIPA